MEKRYTVNHLPVLTWNKLKINNAELETGAAGNTSVGRLAVQADYPEGISVKTVKSNELDELFNGLDIDNPAELVVAGKFPMYNKQRFATGMGADIDRLMDESDIETELIVIDSSYKKEEPVYIYYTPGEKDICLAKSVIYAKKGSRARLVVGIEKTSCNPECTGIKDGCAPSLGRESGLAGLSTRVILEEGAELTIYRVQLLNRGYTFFDDIGAVSDRKSSLDIVKLNLGAGRVYDGLNELQRGEESVFNVDYGFLGLKGSLTDINYNDVFVGKKTNGVMRFFGALFEDAQKAFRGTLDFRAGSVKAVGDEQEDILLFGDEVINKTIPLILCEEEDVDGRHAATIGRLSDDMLFYMQTRGISEEEAKRLMVKAKLNSISRRFPKGALRDRAEIRLKELLGSR